jgi:gluconokinase
MVIALDVGTSSARATLYDADGRPVPGRFHQAAYEPAVTPDGGVEHDAARLVDAVAGCLDAVVGARRRDEVQAVGVATFWHGLLGFDARGQPATPVYMWADTRSTAEAQLLLGALDADAFRARTGCPLHSCYWPAKLRWLERARPAETRRVARWGSIGEHLAQTLLGEAATSVSMASGTGLLDQAASGWDPEALAAAGLDARQLFPLRDRTEPRRGLRRPWATRWPALAAADWFPAVGDGAASSVGSDCADPTRVALNVGTSAALRVVTEQAAAPPRGLWRYRLDRRRAIVGGATSEGGNVWAWCRRVLRLPGDDEVEAALAALPAAGHELTVLPHWAGERAPGWRGDRRGVIAGLRLDTTALEIARAALEAVALRLALVYDLLAPCAAAGHAVVASGGALGRSRVWTQMIADALGHDVSLSPEGEATSRGAALLTLDALGARPAGGAARLPLGETFAPDPARHARYRDALERQRRLDGRV